MWEEKIALASERYWVNFIDYTTTLAYWLHNNFSLLLMHAHSQILFDKFDHPSGTMTMFLLPNDGITAKEQRQLLSQQHK